MNYYLLLLLCCMSLAGAQEKEEKNHPRVSAIQGQLRTQEKFKGDYTITTNSFDKEKIIISRITVRRAVIKKNGSVVVHEVVLKKDS